MTLSSLLQQVKSRLFRSPTARARELDFPSGFEPGLRHPKLPSHLLLRDDGVIEATAGPATTLLVDGAAQTVTAKGAAVRLSAAKIQLDCPADGLYVGYQRLNPFWFSGPLDPISWLAKAPLVLNNPLLLGTKLAIDPTPEGVPNPAMLAAGLISLPLAALMTPQPLFGPNEQLLVLAQSLGRLVKQLAVHLD